MTGIGSADSTIANVPDWQEDANSPWDTGTDSTFTVDLASGGDIVALLLLPNGSGQFGELVVHHGTTTSDDAWDGVDRSGSTFMSATAFKLGTANTAHGWLYAANQSLFNALGNDDAGHLADASAANFSGATTGAFTFDQTGGGNIGKEIRAFKL